MCDRETFPLIKRSALDELPYLPAELPAYLCSFECTLFSDITQHHQVFSALTVAYPPLRDLTNLSSSCSPQVTLMDFACPFCLFKPEPSLGTIRAQY